MCTYTGAERSRARSTIAERSGAPKILCRLERSSKNFVPTGVKNFVPTGAELQKFCADWSQKFCADWSGAPKILCRLERSSKFFVRTGAERSGAETKLTSLGCSCKELLSSFYSCSIIFYYLPVYIVYLYL